MLVELRDREVIAAWCRRRPAVNAYLLGDLDDFFWPYTRWLGWETERGLEQVALVYSEPEVPVLLAFGEPGSGALVALVGALAASLPDRLYAHLGPDGLAALQEAYAVEHGPEPHLKLGLARTDALAEAAAVPVEPLGPGDILEVEAFYATAYPGSWFEPRMLETGRYVGVRERGALVCVAGVHVVSEVYRVAALGNVATQPAARSRGLASAACAHLCRRLLEDGIETISLNVHASNDAARRAYERLGFEQVATYLEVSLVRSAAR